MAHPAQPDTAPLRPAADHGALWGFARDRLAGRLDAAGWRLHPASPETGWRSAHGAGEALFLAPLRDCDLVTLTLYYAAAPDAFGLVLRQYDWPGADEELARIGGDGEAWHLAQRDHNFRRIDLVRRGGWPLRRVASWTEGYDAKGAPRGLAGLGRALDAAVDRLPVLCARTPVEHGRARFRGETGAVIG